MSVAVGEQSLHLYLALQPGGGSPQEAQYRREERAGSPLCGIVDELKIIS